MSAPDHIPRSTALLVLICTQLILSVTELGLLGFLQSVISDGFIGYFATYGVLRGGVGVGLFTTAISIIFATYFLITTRSMFSAYNKVAALIMAMACLVFWTVTWGLVINIFSLHGTRMPTPQYAPDGTVDDVVFEPLGTKIADGIYESTLALAIIQWVIFVALNVLLFRSRSRRHPHAEDAKGQAPEIASVV